jgi:1-acyl-sn-glycerol-3-phosphate acyltransferase
MILTSAALYLLWLVVKGLSAPFPNSGKPFRRWWRRLIFCGWGQSLAAILGMRILIDGEPPQSPFLLVSNHLSYVDIIAYAACLECVFVSRGDVANWPGVGILARSFGTIFINREKMLDIPRVIGEMNTALDAGLGVILFPEGTSGAGDRVLPFHPSLLDPAAKANYPVSFASIRYRTPPGAPPAYMAISWWGDMTFAPHFVDLLTLSKFDACITFGSHAIRSDDRKALAKNLWTAVNDQFAPMVDSSVVSGEKESKR